MTLQVRVGQAGSTLPAVSELEQMTDAELRRELADSNITAARRAAIESEQADRARLRQDFPIS